MNKHSYLDTLQFCTKNQQGKKITNMGKNSIPGPSYPNLLCSFLIICFGAHSFLYQRVQGDDGGGQKNTFTISSYTYQETLLRPYEWQYIRVNLPPWFSSVSIALQSDVDLDVKKIEKSSSTLPMICVREGSPPLPDVYNSSFSGLGIGLYKSHTKFPSLISVFFHGNRPDNLNYGFLINFSVAFPYLGQRSSVILLNYISNSSFGGIKGLQNDEECYPMQKIISVRLTNEQISPGIWYFGLFNGIGPVRTQSKMINRGQSYSFSGNVSVEGCISPMMSGQFCNQIVYSLSCLDSYNLSEDNQTFNQTAENVLQCRNADGWTCHGDDRPKVFSLNVVRIAEKLMITVSNVRYNRTQSSNSTDNSGILLTCYARHGAIPLSTLHDYAGNISQAPLVIQSPKLGRWYVSIQPANLSGEVGRTQNMSRTICYSLEWQVLQCPVDKAGPNCTWERYMLQTVLRKNPSVPFESYYLPMSEKVSSDSANFPLEPLLSNSSYGGNNDVAWTFFLVDIPSGAAGNIHIRLMSDAEINFELYARHGGYPSTNSWDYFCTNSTSSSNNSMFFKLYDFTEKSISFYILYAREGTWSFGLRQLNSVGNGSFHQTAMSISLERCPQKCSSYGTCQSVLDTSGLQLYSYCSCDRNHGGFDCSVELVSHQGHVWQSVSLIASNAAAVLPAYWALRHKAFAEWVLYTASGISSGLYHACDVGTWCALTFHVLQFMDFWLSFMAVVSTFVYLATIDETSKRTIHTVVAIVTAIMAKTGPTRPSNIALVISLGALGLLIGWLIEFCTHYRSFSISVDFRLNLVDRWLMIKEWVQNLFRTLLKRFRWGFVVAGFTGLGMAAISWKLESSQTYWIWHSLWHVTIYSSSFLFLCSKAKPVNCEHERPSDGNYVLTRQNSFSGGEQRVDR